MSGSVAFPCQFSYNFMVMISQCADGYYGRRFVVDVPKLSGACSPSRKCTPGSSSTAGNLTSITVASRCAGVLAIALISSVSIWDWAGGRALR